MTIGREIEKKIVRILDKSENPLSTSDLAARIGRAWHAVQHHCFRLQIEGRINGFRVGRMNLWQKANGEKKPEKKAEKEAPKKEKEDYEAPEDY